MRTAKIIRHRHKMHHYINDDLKSVSEDVQFKIVFSSPDDMKSFLAFVKSNGGLYDYDKSSSRQNGKMPKIPALDEVMSSYCWCDIMSYYLLHVADFEFHSTIEPYKGEIYIHKNDAD